jgi:hypothetical protein
MTAFFKNEPPKQIQTEKITFSGIKSFDPSDPGLVTQGLVTPGLRSKTFRWGTQQSGDCTMDAPMLWITNDGVFEFSGNLSSSGSDDSWGILHIDLQQDNGHTLWSSGAFWSPTIGGWAPWTIWSTYPKFLFDSVERAQFWSHC